MTSLDAWREGRRVARVDDATGRLRLTWDAAVTEHHPVGSPVLSVRLDAQPPDVHPAAQLVRAHLGGLLPERGTAARARLAARAATSSDDVLGLLARHGGDVPGAVVYTPSGTVPGHGHLEPLADDAAVRRHLERSLTDEHVGLGDSSLPGVQPKTALTLLEGRWSRPRGGAASTHVVKPQLPDRPSLVHDEAWAARAARAVGLAAAPSRVVDFDGLPALVVERFDRRVEGGAVRRVHQEDGAQALGLSSDDLEAKFGWHRPAANLRAVAALLTADGGDVEPLLRWTALTVLVGNTDAHAKNVALLHGDDARVSLAPVYDVSPHAHLGRDRWAMSVAGGFEVHRTSLDDVVAEARSWRVPQRRARAVVADVVDRFRCHLRDDETHPSSAPALAWVRRHVDALSAPAPPAR